MSGNTQKSLNSTIRTRSFKQLFIEVKDAKMMKNTHSACPPYRILYLCPTKIYVSGTKRSFLIQTQAAKSKQEVVQNYECEDCNCNIERIQLPEVGDLLSPSTRSRQVPDYWTFISISNTESASTELFQ
jgi:hypothetical protein